MLLMLFTHLDEQFIFIVTIIVVFNLGSILIIIMGHHHSSQSHYLFSSFILFFCKVDRALDIIRTPDIQVSFFFTLEPSFCTQYLSYLLLLSTAITSKIGFLIFLIQWMYWLLQMMVYFYSLTRIYK